MMGCFMWCLWRIHSFKGVWGRRVFQPKPAAIPAQTMPYCQAWWVGMGRAAGRLGGRPDGTATRAATFAAGTHGATGIAAFGERRLLRGSAPRPMTLNILSWSSSYTGLEQCLCRSSDLPL